MTAIYLDDGLSPDEIADTNAEIQAISRLRTVEIMASSVLKRDKIAEIQGDSYNPPATILIISNSDLYPGWIQVCILLKCGCAKWYRLAQSELVTVEG